MQFRVLGKGGIAVFQLCSGTMTFRIGTIGQLGDIW
jgi:aryl-alcohol dehydrogenase-like predicted oxidoreductase